MPLSDFVPEVTLIAFPILPSRLPHGGRAFSSREPPFVSRQENGLDYGVGADPARTSIRPGSIPAAF
jgi:hypothetical protein